mgnify:CR=1 FL=1
MHHGCNHQNKMGSTSGPCARKGLGVFAEHGWSTLSILVLLLFQERACRLPTSCTSQLRLPKVHRDLWPTWHRVYSSVVERSTIVNGTRLSRISDSKGDKAEPCDSPPHGCVGAGEPRRLPHRHGVAQDDAGRSQQARIRLWRRQPGVCDEGRAAHARAAPGLLHDASLVRAAWGHCAEVGRALQPVPSNRPQAFRCRLGLIELLEYPLAPSGVSVAGRGRIEVQRGTLGASSTQAWLVRGLWRVLSDGERRGGKSST